MSFDTLRPPSLLDPSATAYKDWLHLNVFDHASGSVGLFNLSLHGSPWDERARAIGTALLHVPGRGWVGNMVVEPIAAAQLGLCAISLARVALAVEHRQGTVLASSRLPEDAFWSTVSARSVAAPVAVERRMPFGPGWISWYAIPRLVVQGSAALGNETFDFGAASAYHDHNWGRWHWGEDVGWEWGVFLAPLPGPAIVWGRVTDRLHRRPAASLLVVDVGGTRRWFGALAVTLEYEGEVPTPVRRLPGALAALHQDRAAPRLPQRVRIRADDGLERVELEFGARAAAQLIAGDPASRGYGFLHEMVGEFEVSGRVADRSLSASGLAVYEHVD